MGTRSDSCFTLAPETLVEGCPHLAVCWACCTIFSTDSAEHAGLREVECPTTPRCRARVPIPEPTRGPWVQVRSGNKLFPLDPQPQEILVDDVAWSLSRLARFLGHTEGAPVTVAEHSVRVAFEMERLVPEEQKTQALLVGLLHDAAEAYMADLSAPLKKTGVAALYRFYEDRLALTVYRSLGVDLPVPESLQALCHRLDSLAGATEARLFFPSIHPDWPLPKDGVRGYGRAALSSDEAYRLFLNTFHHAASRWAKEKGLQPIPAALRQALERSVVHPSAVLTGHTEST